MDLTELLQFDKIDNGQSSLMGSQLSLIGSQLSFMGSDGTSGNFMGFTRECKGNPWAPCLAIRWLNPNA